MKFLSLFAKIRQNSLITFLHLVILINLFSACTVLQPDPRLPEYFGATESDLPVLYLGDVFDRVNEWGELEWDAQPLPGSSFKMLLVADGIHKYDQASVELRPFNQALTTGRLVESTIGTFPANLKTVHRFIEIQIPADAAPGFQWLAVNVDGNEFGPIRIEIADPVFIEARQQVFGIADAVLAETFPEVPFLLTALMSPVKREALVAALATEDLPANAWPVFATRLDKLGRIILDGEQPSDVLLLVDSETQKVSVHQNFGLANWTLYNYPAKPPRGGYNGWWWKQPNLPAGGTCGTAWCNYPFPGNRVKTISNQLAIITDPVDPQDWWSGRGDGWVCGNGWFHRRRGPGGYTMGPWWPMDRDGKPKPELGGPMPEEEEEEEASTPPPVSAPRRPPGIQPPPEAASCTMDFVEAISKYTYGRPPYGRRIREARLGGQTARYANLPNYEGNLRWARFPMNWTRNGGYEYAWTADEANAELRRNQSWWANYCVALSNEQIVLPNNRRLRRFARRYKRWLDNLPVGANPNVVMGLSDAMTNEGVALYGEARKIYARAAGKRRLKGALHILFLPRVVARTGHTGNRGRPTETSFTDPAFPFVALNQLDRDDPYILVHELIHALGRPPGTYTWDHQSGDPRAMSRITRRTVREAAGLSAGRLLDYGEYDEILSSGNLRPVRRTL